MGLGPAANYAVLTGDIVKSTRLTSDQLELVRDHVFQGAAIVGKWQPGLVRGKPDFFRGDAWQLLITDPARALRVAFFIRSFLRSKSADSSLAIGIGPAENISSRRISLSTGAAFLRSGRALDDLQSGRRMAIGVGEENRVRAAWLPVVLQLSEAIIDRFSNRQAELVALAIHPDKPTQEQIANSLEPKVDRQVVAKTLDRASFQALEAAVTRFEAEDWSGDSGA